MGRSLYINNPLILNFVLQHSFHLKYFIPLVIEANKNENICNFITFDNKNDHPAHPCNNIEEILGLSKKYGFNFIIKKLKDNYLNGICFFGERRGISNVIQNKNINKIVLVCLRDFVNKDWYDYYINLVDYVIFPSLFFSDYYNKKSPKNLYFGSPKYDVEFDKNDVLNKYNLKPNRNALVMAPDNGYEFVDNNKIRKIYDYLHRMNFFIIVKGRGHQLANSKIRGDYYIEDHVWFPHPTMELLNVVDMVINFDSAVVKECVMYNVPFINFHITKEWKPFRFLYNYKYADNIDGLDIGYGEFKNRINYLLQNDIANDFKLARKNHLFERGNSSKLILKFIYENFTDNLR